VAYYFFFSFNSKNPIARVCGSDEHDANRIARRSVCIYAQAGLSAEFLCVSARYSRTLESFAHAHAHASARGV